MIDDPISGIVFIGLALIVTTAALNMTTQIARNKTIRVALWILIGVVIGVVFGPWLRGLLGI